MLGAYSVRTGNNFFWKSHKKVHAAKDYSEIFIKNLLNKENHFSLLSIFMFLCISVILVCAVDPFLLPL